MTPVINEVMSLNLSTIQDEDGEYSDWIELYNPGTTAVDLTGYGLSDDPSDPFKWTFPGCFLSPGEHKLVFASDKDRKTVGNHLETVVDLGDTWRYFVGESEPPSNWNLPGFDSSGWLSGPSGFGYADKDDATEIDIREYDAVSLYIITTFTVEDVSNIINCLFHIDYDDAFVAYINGTEIARVGIGQAGIAPRYDETASSNHEAQMHQDGEPDEFEIDDIVSLITEGKNVLAVQVHNGALSSSDMTAIPFLTFEMPEPPSNPAGISASLAFSTPYLHTNFKISSEGETIVLTDPSGSLVDLVETGTLSADVSRGRKSDGGTEWLLFPEPTPETGNTTEGFSGYFESLVQTSYPGGYYNGILSVELELSVDSSTAVIRYTLDGTEPDEASVEYTTALSIDTTTVLRARAFEDGLLPGQITTATYTMNTDHIETVIPEFYITCYNDDFNYIYENYSQDVYIPVTVTFQGQHWPDARLRIRGDSTRRLDKKSLRLVFDGLPFVNGRDVLIFNSEYLDRSYMQQYLSSRLMRESGQPAYESEHARLYINGDFLGLYLRIENVDEDFLEARGLDPEGNLYKATYDRASLSIYDDVDRLWEKKTNSDTGRSDLIELIDNLENVPEHEYYEFAQNNYDYEKMVNILAMNMLVANGSTYYHNYYMYHDIHGSNKWIMFPWDMDKTISAYGVNYNHQRSSQNHTNDNPFHERALINDTILNDIRARIEELSTTLFTPEYLNPVIDSLQTVLQTSVEQDDTDNIADIDEWQTHIGRELNYIRDRRDALLYQIDNWPRSFRVDKTLSPFTENVTLTWHPSGDPNGDQITYRVGYDRSWAQNDTLGTMIYGITDTTYTIQESLAPGTYYWAVHATDGEKWVEGSDSRNTFVVAEGNPVPAEIQGDERLTLSRSPYVITEDITVTPGASLTIDAGVEIILSDSASIYVEGEIHVNGTSGLPVTFRPSEHAERWGAICIDNATGNSNFNHAIIRGASRGDDEYNFIAAVSSLDSEITYDNVEFDDNVQCIFGREGLVTVRNCIFNDTNENEHINIKFAEALVEGCSFRNVRNGGDAIDYDGIRDGAIRNNEIYLSFGDGIDIGDGCSNVSISGNRIIDCADKGISVGELSTDIHIEQNTIVGSSYGVAVKDSSIAFIDHTTFYDNDVAITAYEKGVVAFGGGTAVVTNSILAGSLMSAVSADSLSTVTVSYSLADTELLPGTGNIMGDPLFVSPLDQDFYLLPESPAIDAGNPSSEPDPDGTRTDMGALYHHADGEVLVINEINYRSTDEFNPGDWIELYNPLSAPLDISGWIFKDENDAHEFRFQVGTVIGAGEYFVLSNNAFQFHKTYPDVENYIGNFEFGLSSQGELLRLFNDQGILIDSVPYDEEAPWPVISAENNGTIALLNTASDNSLSSNWVQSSVHGTPGTLNDEFTGIHETSESDIPTTFSLGQNYPNPFNPSTTFRYEIPADSHVEFIIYDILGRKVATLLNEIVYPGVHEVVWNGRNSGGDFVGSGVYLFRFRAGDYIKQGKMMFLR